MKKARSEKQIGSIRVLGRYVLLQLPGIIMLSLLLIFLYMNDAISGKFLWLILMIWIAKDIVLYPFVWRVYDPDHESKKYSMIGLKGVASERLDPLGYINVQGELWRAKAVENRPVIEAGEIVTICEVEGITLLVKREGNKLEIV
jgi:membrane protein implicated in regulation of membrane protease activity